jgi:hypothetical protein
VIWNDDYSDGMSQRTFGAPGIGEAADNNNNNNNVNARASQTNVIRTNDGHGRSRSHVTQTVPERAKTYLRRDGAMTAGEDCSNRVLVVQRRQN